MTSPDIQYFGEDGTWVKPAGAARVDVVARGGDGGSAMGGKGGDGGGATYIDCLATPDAIASHAPPGRSAGTLSVLSYTAGELPGEVTVTIGKGGRPDGRDGYVVIITHLEPQ